MHHQLKTPHVLRLTPHFYWPHLAQKGWPVKFDTIGGMQTQIYRQTLALAQHGVRQSVMTLRLPDTDPCWSPAPGVEVQGVRIPIFPIKSRIRGMVDLNPSWFLGVIAAVMKRRGRFDLVHAHCSGVFWPLALAMGVSKWLDIPMVITIHCALHSTYRAMSRVDKFLLPFSRMLERRAIDRSACTVVLTTRTLEAYRTQGLTQGQNFAIVPDSIDTDAFRRFGTPAHRQAFVERFGISDDEACVTNLGRIAHEKGWRNLITLAQELRDLKIRILVCGDGNQRSELESEIERAGLKDRFTITGYLNHEEVPGALARTDVLVLPSIHEEFGGVLLEAMAMEKPSVAFRVGGVPTVLRDGEMGRLVEAGNVSAMAQAVREILTSPSLAREMGSRGKAYVGRRFSLDAAGAKLKNIYRQVLEQNESQRIAVDASWQESRLSREMAGVAYGERPSRLAEESEARARE